MDLKMRYEIKQLMKIGIPEDLATINVCVKYDKKHLVEDLIEEQKQEQELLREELEQFIEFEKIIVEPKDGLKDETLE